MSIRIEGASEHNLRDVDVEFGDGLTVVTGVSGSGKTSLVFDTLYHEARRRFLDIFSLGPAAERLAPARVRSITGLGPAYTLSCVCSTRTAVNASAATAAVASAYSRRTRSSRCCWRSPPAAW